MMIGRTVTAGLSPRSVLSPPVLLSFPFPRYFFFSSLGRDVAVIGITCMASCSPLLRLLVASHVRGPGKTSSLEVYCGQVTPFFLSMSPSPRVVSIATRPWKWCLVTVRDPGLTCAQDLIPHPFLLNLFPLRLTPCVFVFQSMANPHFCTGPAVRPSASSLPPPLSFLFPFEVCSNVICLESAAAHGQYGGPVSFLTHSLSWRHLFAG